MTIRTLTLPLVLCCFSSFSGCALDEPLKDKKFEPAMAKPPQLQVRSPDGSIYNESRNQYLFEDIKARRVGDLITIVLEERTNAAKSASTSTNKNTGIGIPSPTLFGVNPTYKGKNILEMSIDSDQAFKGIADTTQSNRLSGEITVTIAEVYPNGTMQVKGEKLLTLNQGSEIVRISGLVRPTDISPDNTITSNLIANAEITYSGNGPIADANKPGWFTRLIGGVLWPF